MNDEQARELLAAGRARLVLHSEDNRRGDDMKVTFEFCGERYSPTLADARDHRVSNEKTMFVVDCFSGVSVDSDGFDDVMYLLEGYFALLLELEHASA